MNSLFEHSEKVAIELDMAGFTSEACELRASRNRANNEAIIFQDRLDALSEFEARAHVRWLGDLYLPHLSQSDWWKCLDSLQSSAKKMRMKLWGK